MADRVLEDGRDTFVNLKEVIEREGIECHLEQNGRFVGAHCPNAYRALEKRARQYEAEGLEGFELVPRERQQEVIGESDYYYGGLHEPDGGSLHPGLYHQGLVKACARHGVSPLRQDASRGNHARARWFSRPHRARCHQVP